VLVAGAPADDQPAQPVVGCSQTDKSSHPSRFQQTSSRLPLTVQRRKKFGDLQCERGMELRLENSGAMDSTFRPTLATYGHRWWPSIAGKILVRVWARIQPKIVRLNPDGSLDLLRGRGRRRKSHGGCRPVRRAVLLAGDFGGSGNPEFGA
jgi:hypothetical protein